VELTSNHVAEAAVCFDPECLDDTGTRSVAEPEQDGDHRYLVCTVCGGEFGYTRITPADLDPDIDGTCAVGVPADLRRRASAAMENTLAAAQPLPLLQIGRRRAPAA
jgi:hypothetical protein